MTIEVVLLIVVSRSPGGPIRPRSPTSLKYFHGSKRFIIEEDRSAQPTPSDYGAALRVDASEPLSLNEINGDSAPQGIQPNRDHDRDGLRRGLAIARDRHVLELQPGHGGPSGGAGVFARSDPRSQLRCAGSGKGGNQIRRGRERLFGHDGGGKGPGLQAVRGGRRIPFERGGPRHAWGFSLLFEQGIRRLVGARTSSRYRDLHRGRRSLPGPIQNSMGTSKVGAL